MNVCWRRRSASCSLSTPLSPRLTSSASLLLELPSLPPSLPSDKLGEERPSEPRGELGGDAASSKSCNCWGWALGEASGLLVAAVSLDSALPWELIEGGPLGAELEGPAYSRQVTLLQLGDVRMVGNAGVWFCVLQMCCCVGVCAHLQEWAWPRGYRQLMALRPGLQLSTIVRWTQPKIGQEKRCLQWLTAVANAPTQSQSGPRPPLHALKRQGSLKLHASDPSSISMVHGTAGP